MGLLAFLVLISVPAYLWRRPKPVSVQETARIEVDAGIPDAAPAPVAPVSTAPRFTLSQPKTVRCGARSGRRNSEHCDELSSVGDALSKAIRDSVACARPSSQPYTVSFVLTLEFDRQKAHVWAGRSGTLRRRAAADLIQCVQRAIVMPSWAVIPHEFARYDVNVMASYPATVAAPAQFVPPSRTSLVPLGGP